MRALDTVESCLPQRSQARTASKGSAGYCLPLLGPPRFRSWGAVGIASRAWAHRLHSWQVPPKGHLSCMRCWASLFQHTIWVAHSKGEEGEIDGATGSVKWSVHHRVWMLPTLYTELWWLCLPSATIEDDAQTISFTDLATPRGRSYQRIIVAVSCYRG